MSSRKVQDQKRDAIPVARVKPKKMTTSPDGVRSRVTTGKPRKITRAAMQSKFASCGAPAYMGYGGSGGGLAGGSGLRSGGGGGGMGGRLSGTIEGGGGNFYSPELSTDFLELPQSLDEKRNTYRFFYRAEPFIGQAIDILTDLPLSKIRLSIPKAKDSELARKAFAFCDRWAEEIGLLQYLRYILHEYNLLGEAFVFVEDNSPDMPQEITHVVRRILPEKGNPYEKWVELPDADERSLKWLKKNYRGWSDIQVVPPERVQARSFAFTKEKIFELSPSSDERKIVEEAAAGDKEAMRIVDSMPLEIVQAIVDDEPVKLNTDADAGSFIYHLSRKKSYYETQGHSVLERCLRVLTYRDKLRQAQTSIASRHMTPIRIVWVEDGDVYDVEDLREQVDLALMDPDYSIITNFQVNWEEMGANQRLLDLNGEYEQTDRQLYAGLGVTESLLSGESSYGGDRINLEVINTRFMTLREDLSRFVEQQLLKPMCKRMGFIEEDEDGNDVVLYPRMSFTRLALRDNNDTFDAMLNLYQKGSLDVDVILELLNIDPETTTRKLEEHKFTLKDATFNELLRAVYSDSGRMISENSNIAEKIAEALGVEYTPPPPEGSGGRF